MKIGFSSYSLSRSIACGDLSVRDLIPWIAEKGGEHLEVCPGGPLCLEKYPNLIELLKKQSKFYGIDLSSYTIAADFTKNPEKETKRVKTHVDIAAKLGVTRMRHDAGWRPAKEATDEQFEADLPAIANACREVADYAKQFGIITSIENHGFHFQHSKRVTKLIDTVARDNFKLTLDVGNFACVDEDNLAAVERSVSYASMVHFKDFYIRDWIADTDGFFESAGGKFLRGSIVGHGDIDLRPIAEIIKNKYSGYVSIEFEGMEDPQTGCQMSLCNLKKLLQK